MNNDLKDYASWEYAALFRDLRSARTAEERDAIQMALRDMDSRISRLKSGGAPPVR